MLFFYEMGGWTILEKPGIYEMTSGHLILYMNLRFIKGVNLTHFIMGNLKGYTKLQVIGLQVGV